MFNSSTYNSAQYNSTVGLNTAVPIVGAPAVLDQIMGSQVIIEDYRNDIVLSPSVSGNTLDLSSPNTTIELNSDNNTITL